MNSHFRVIALAVGVLCASAGFAQMPAPATVPPAKVSPSIGNATTTTTTTTTAPAAKPAVDSTAQPKATARVKTAMPTTAAAGGGQGQVWVNTKTGAYHCEGTKYYGKTKAGEYMLESDAKAKGFHADHKKACTK